MKAAEELIDARKCAEMKADADQLEMQAKTDADNRVQLVIQILKVKASNIRRAFGLYADCDLDDDDKNFETFVDKFESNRCNPNLKGPFHTVMNNLIRMIDFGYDHGFIPQWKLHI